MGWLNTFIRAVVMGLKGAALFYVAFIVLGLPGALILGTLNGFLDAVLIFIKNRRGHKIVLFFLGLAMTLLIFYYSLRLGLPDWLTDYFIYEDEGAGGLEPGGWFAFFMELRYYARAYLFGFPFGIVICNARKGVYRED